MGGDAWYNVTVRNDTHYFRDIDYYSSKVTSGVDFRAKNFDSIENLKLNSIDFYASVKSLYLQDRQQRILNSKQIVNTQNDSDWEEIDSNKQLALMKIKYIFFYFKFQLNKIIFNKPDVFVQSTVNRASSVLSNDISLKKKISELKLIAKETVDIRGIGFYTLGSIRKDLNDEQKKKYSLLFEQYFLKSFSSRLAEYTNPEISVEGKKVLNENYTIVNSLLKGTNESQR